jgi:hypothetical protein
VDIFNITFQKHSLRNWHRYDARIRWGKWLQTFLRSLNVKEEWRLNWCCYNFTSELVAYISNKKLANHQSKLLTKQQPDRASTKNTVHFEVPAIRTRSAQRYVCVCLCVCALYLLGHVNICYYIREARVFLRVNSTNLWSLNSFFEMWTVFLNTM